MEEKLNIHQKLLKVLEMAGVLQKNKDGYNYKYVTEDEIQAKVTAGMKKYGLMLYPNIVPGTFHVQPISYEKYDKKANKGAGGLVPVNETIVSCEMLFRWVNVDNPEETVEVQWGLVGQMEDAAQAFGAGLTYTNRYFLLKSLQVATTESDPDNYRSKQKEAEFYFEQQAAEELQEQIDEKIAAISAKGSELIAAGVQRDEIYKAIADCNNGDKNPNHLDSVEACDAVMEKLMAIKPTKTKSAKETK